DGENVAFMGEAGNYSGQFWELTPQGEGYFRLTNQFLGEDRALDSDGDVLFMGQTGDTTTQLWALIPTQTATTPCPAQSIAEAVTTSENVAEPTNTPEPTPEPTSTPESAAEPTNTPQPTPKPTNAPAPTAAAATTSAGNLSFEQFGTWKRGDQPYGTFSQSGNPVQEGSFAGKLNYDFSAATDADDFVIFTQPIATSGTPNLVKAWVNGDGSGHLFNIWVQDANNEVWAVPMGAIAFNGWQQMAGAIDANAPWPGGHVYGPKNGTIDYPIKFLGLVVDRTGGPKTGALSFDDITFSKGEAPATLVDNSTNTAEASDCPTIEGAIQVTCYDIEGSTVDELVASRAQNSPGSRFIGLTSSPEATWRWDGDGQGNCLLDTTTVSTVGLNPYIAIWKSPTGASSDLVAQWENYSTRRIERLQLVVKLWLDRYKEIESAIKGATCATANDVGENTRRRILDEILAQTDATLPDVEFAGHR
ncbi:MAG: flagellar filament outer layer protein FlaA, partial [Chloroflexota bacterium]